MRVEIISESASIDCTFLRAAKELETPSCMSTSCNATITYGETCQKQEPLYGMRDSDNHCLVVISLRSFLDEKISKYCTFRVNATANTRTVTVDEDLCKLVHPIF